MSQMKDTPSTDGPLNKREPLGDAVSPGADDGAWKDRLAEARAQREAVLAEKAQRGEGEAKKKLKPWERAELAAAERRKQREDSGAVTRKPVTPEGKAPVERQDTHPVAALSAATEAPLVLETAAVAASEAPEKRSHRRIWAVAAVFLIGLGAGFVVAAPDRIAGGFKNLQVLFGNGPEPTRPQDTVAALATALGDVDEIGSLIPDSQRPSDVALAEVALGQAAFRIGPPEPFTERSSAPQEVAKAFFGDKTTPRLLASDRIAGPSQVSVIALVDVPRPTGRPTTLPQWTAPEPPSDFGRLASVDDDADFVRYAPFQPAPPGAETALASDALRAPSTAFGIQPPVTAEDVVNAVQLSSITAPELPTASGVSVGQALSLPSQIRNSIGTLLAPERPDRLDLGSTPIRLAALTEGSRLDFESPLFDAAVVPTARDGDAGFQRAASLLASEPARPVGLPPVAVAPLVDTWAALPDLGAGPGTTQPIELVALWSDSDIAQIESLLTRPDEASAFAPSDAVTNSFESTPTTRFPGLDILVWAPQATSDERVAEVEQSLKEAGFAIDPANRLDIRITQDQVRYFQPSSAEAAAILANAIGARLRDFTNFRPAPPEGTIEVWLRGEEAAPPAPTRVVRAPRPPRQTQAQREEQQLLQLRNRLIQTLRQNNF